MFKQKTIYIVILLCLSVVLVADVAAAMLLPAESGRSGLEGGASRAAETMPQQEAGSLDGGQMPQEMPADFEMEPQRGTPGGSGFSGTVQKYWLVIAGACLAGILGCVFMLVVRRKREKTETEEADPTQMPQLRGVDEDDPPKRKKEWAMPLAFFLVLAVAIAALPTPSQEAASSREVAQSVHSGSPENGTISRTLYTSGTLSDEDSISIKIPSDVVVTEFLVANGQRVQQGEVLLTVEKSSVMSCIRELQERLDALDDEIEEEADATVSSVISAPAEARVKEIYAAADETVVSTMYRYGMLLRLSLDGLMAVDLETDALEVGQSVVVTLSDGTEEDGRVTQVQDGIAHITLSDENAQYDDAVTVATEGGEEVGTGNLIINSELRITGYAGTVSRVYAEEGKKVSKGSTLLSLTDTDIPARRESLLKQREEMEEQLSQLIQMVQDGCIYSEFDGIVSGIDETLVEELSSEGTGYQVVLLSNITYSTQSQEAETPPLRLLAALEDASGSEGSDPSDPPETTDPSDPPETTDPSVPPETTDPSEPSETTDPSEPSETTDPSEPPETTDPSEPTEPTEPEHTPGDPADYTNYGAVVTAVSYGQISIQATPEPVYLSSYGDLSGLDQTQMTEPASLSGGTVFTYGEGGWVKGDLSSVKAGDLLVLSYDSDGNLAWIIRSPGQSGGTVPSGGGQEMPGSSGGAMPSTGGGGSQQQVEPTPTEPLEETVACAMVPVETVTVTVDIDELDVGSIQEGMTAQVTLDAIPGQSFSATVAEVATDGESEGGNTKYEAIVSMERTEKMLAGMTASVMLTLEQKENCLTVPAEALQETEEGTMVYTTYDEKTDTLGTPVKVETGLSDGSSVEILSGVSYGDSFYYRYADTIVYFFVSDI